MSRIGNNPIKVPDGVSVEIQKNLITIKGKMGELTQEFSEVSVSINDNIINVYFEELGFQKIKLWENKFDYLIDKSLF